MDSSTKLWKYLALTCAAVYVYKIAQGNGGTLAGNKAGINLNTDKITDSLIPWMNLNPVIRPVIHQGMKKVLSNLNGRPL